ncbi:hypothetical protein [Phaeacidiphilus oryzae]|uniref:hypothetical protein n=1 Tax=Phaeacidiphilus oryzae TaxID=348818 RepID=UPI00055AEA87|nr:hypothetical protein [Phaeacidiphilus oryzae]
MMPKDNPVHVPSYLLGEADPDTLEGLVRSSRRLGRHWPPLPGGRPSEEEPSEERPERPERPRRGFRVPARTADLIARMPEYGG